MPQTHCLRPHTDLSGTDKANIVELSRGLSANNSVTRTLDFKDDSASDQLVLNVDDANTTWITYNANGTVATGGATFKFNVVNNFDLSSAEDKVGVFYSGSNKSRGGTSIMSSFVEITPSTNSLAYKLADGRVYEDQVSGELTAANAADTDISEQDCICY